jgi:hypothetical protein
MIKRPTLYVLWAFVLALAGLVYYQRWQENRPQEPEPTPASTRLWELDSQAVARLEISRRGGGSFSMGRSPAGLWEAVGAEPDTTDLARAEAAISQLAALQTSATLPAGSLAVFGLQDPAYTLTLTLNGGGRYVLKVGDLTPLGSGYYVQLNDNAPQVVNNFSLDSVLAMVDAPPLVPAPTPDAEEENEAEE